VNKGWTKIYHTNDLHLAEILKGALEENNILCVLINKKDSSYLSFGDIELYVKPEDVINALRIIKEKDA
jgi:hypothetical protein